VHLVGYFIWRWQILNLTHDCVFVIWGHNSLLSSHFYFSNETNMKTIVCNVVYVWVETFRTYILAQYWELNFGKVCHSICTMLWDTESYVSHFVTTNVFLINSQLNLAILQVRVAGSVQHMILLPQLHHWDCTQNWTARPRYSNSSRNITAIQQDSLLLCAVLPHNMVLTLQEMLTPHINTIWK
jgi:hypothetical protein